MDPVVTNALCTVVGAVIGYAANWWQNNRKNVIAKVATEVGDLVDDLEELTGVDLPDSLEDQIDEVVEDVVSELEDTISDAAEDVQEALREGESLSDALHASLSDEIAALKGRIDELDSLTVDDLKIALKTLDLSARGNKGELLERLTTALEALE